MNIQQIMANTEPFRTFHRPEFDYLYMTTPSGEILKAVKRVNGNDIEFEYGISFIVEELIAEDWEFC